MLKNDNPPEISLTWNAGAGVGPFKFGEKIDVHSWALEEPSACISSSPAETARQPKGHADVYVYSEHGQISSISSHSTFIIGSTNIVELSRTRRRDAQQAALDRYNAAVADARKSTHGYLSDPRETHMNETPSHMMRKDLKPKRS